MIVKAGQPFTFNYPAWDRATDLFVAGNVFDVTSGTAVLLEQVEMTDVAGLGIYEGQFTPEAGKSYLVIGAVYTDSGFTTPDLSRGPEADQFDCFVSSTALMSFNYGAFDQADDLTIVAHVYDVTTGQNLVSMFTMAYVALGVYFGQYLGTLSKDYLVGKIPSDLDRAIAADSFSVFEISGGGSSTPQSPFYVEGQNLKATLTGQSIEAILTEVIS